MEFLSTIFQSALQSAIASPLQWAGLASGVLCVWLLIRENLLTFPIGLFFALITIVVMWQERLFADVLLNGYYVVMNGYGWYFWVRAGKRDKALEEGAHRIRDARDRLVVTLTPDNEWLPMIVVTALGTGVMGWWFANFTSADLPYWDSATTVMSFTAMWMTARKYLENWMVWLVVDVIQTGLYLYKGIYPYALLYGLYLGMAVAGWLAWRRSMQLAAAA